MFGFIKHLLRKTESAPAHKPAVTISRPVSRHAISTVSSATLANVRKNLAQHQNGRGVKVPLQPILAGLPLELQPRVLRPEVGEATISIPLEKILAQLSRGSVRISFGDLRQAAPDVFSPEPDRDKVPVLVPLSEILPQLNPALIQRRRAQKHIEVPSEISSPFESHQALAIAAASAKPHRPSAPAHRPVTPAPSLPSPEPLSMPNIAMPEEPTPQEPPRIAMRTEPPAPALPLRPSLTSAPTPPAPTAASPSAPALPPGRPALQPHSPAAPSNGNGAKNSEALLLGLTSLADTWPEPVRKEIVDLNLVDASVALPFAEVEQALKSGKIIFTWKTLRSWIRPAPLQAESPHDSACLELPLNVVAPVFIERQRQNIKPHQKISIDEDIPNLFFGFPQPEAPPTGANARPADTNFYVWDDSSDMVKVHESETRRGPSPGTRFVAKYATPNEVVSRAAAQEGVAGSLIALPDGLMVASQLPSDVNGDTLAAFLPQIFGKVSQCTKELRMGELNNLNFTVGNVPWKIFRVNSIFFAAFGRAGEPLPTAQLAGLAAELDHKPK